MLPDPEDFCRLILLRHPELAADHQHRAVGSGAAELSRRGRAKVLDWLQVLEGVQVDAVFAADVPQCREPAQAIATQKGLELGLDARLLDQQLGEWQGRPWDEIAQQNPERLRDFFAEFGEHLPPGGESLGQSLERVLGWWKDQAPTGAGRTLAVVLAGALISSFTAAMLGMRLSRSISLTLPHAGIGILDVYANGVKLAAWNVEALS